MNKYGFVPVAEQVAILQKLLPRLNICVEPNWEKDHTLPLGADGWGVILKRKSILNPDNGETVEKLIKRLSRGFNNNVRKWQVDQSRYHDADMLVKLQFAANKQKGDAFVIPIRFGRGLMWYKVEHMIHGKEKSYVPGGLALNETSLGMIEVTSLLLGNLRLIASGNHRVLCTGERLAKHEFGFMCTCDRYEPCKTGYFPAFMGVDSLYERYKYYPTFGTTPEGEFDFAPMSQKNLDDFITDTADVFLPTGFIV
jgi:hypothetical protein